MGDRKSAYVLVKKHLEDQVTDVRINITIVKGKDVRVHAVQARMWTGGRTALILNLGARWR
jgi:hypothetical protein